MQSVTSRLGTRKIHGIPDLSSPLFDSPPFFYKSYSVPTPLHADRRIWYGSETHRETRCGRKGLTTSQNHNRFLEPCRSSWQSKTTPTAMRPQPSRQDLLDPPAGWCRRQGCSPPPEFPEGKALSTAQAVLMNSVNAEEVPQELLCTRLRLKGACEVTPVTRVPCLADTVDEFQPVIITINSLLV